jgi:L-aspartate oxidase
MLPGAPRFLISEAVRGEGARLLDRQGNSPVADLTGGDLAPRDQVSRALARRMQEDGVDHLWLDLRPVGEHRLNQQFPTILGRCRELGLEPTQAPIPVAPAAHYWMGGVATDLQAATSLPGLYAIGEVACTGVHGANRLASNSLMECLVFARQLGQIQLEPMAARAQGSEGAQGSAAAPCQIDLAIEGLSGAQIDHQISLLRDLCWQAAGVERWGHGLAAALRTVQRQRQELESQPLWHQLHQREPGRSARLSPEAVPLLKRVHDLHLRLSLAELLMEAALFREESRGGHFRIDAPSKQPFWQRHSVQQRGEPIRTSSQLG